MAANVKKATKKATKKDVKVTVSLKSSDQEISEALKKAGVLHPEGCSRESLIRYAEDAKIWVQFKPSVVRESYKLRYGPDQNCGDEIAALLLNTDYEQVARQNGIDLSRWEGKNPGMIRMNLGNVVRGRIRRGERTVIGDTVFNDL